MEFVTTGEKEIRFWRIDANSCVSYNPFVSGNKKSTKELKQGLTQTIFLPEDGNGVAVSGTDDGNLIVWDVILIMEDEGNMNHRREVKSISLYNKAKGTLPSIQVLTIYNKYLVVGTSSGSIRFYDFRFRIICWFEEFNLKSITSISFKKQIEENNGKVIKKTET